MPGSGLTAAAQLYSPGKWQSSASFYLARLGAVQLRACARVRMGIIHEARGFRVWKVLLSHSFTLTDTSLPESTAKTEA